MRCVEQRPVMGLDHPDARAHDPRELVHLAPRAVRISRHRLPMPSRIRSISATSNLRTRPTRTGTSSPLVQGDTPSSCCSRGALPSGQWSRAAASLLVLTRTLMVYEVRIGPVAISEIARTSSPTYSAMFFNDTQTASELLRRNIRKLRNGRFSQEQLQEAMAFVGCPVDVSKIERKFVRSRPTNCSRSLTRRHSTLTPNQSP